MTKQNMTTKACSLALFSMAFLCTASCELSRTITSPTPDDSASAPMFGSVASPGMVTTYGTYQTQGNRLISQTMLKDSVGKSSYCLYSKTGKMDSLVTSEYTLRASDTLSWSFRGDSLILGWWGDTSYTRNDSVPYISEQIYLRTSGTSQTLSGNYRQIGAHQRLLRPLPAKSADSAFLVRMDTLSSIMFRQLLENSLTLRDGKLTASYRSLVTWADYELMEWNGDFPIYSTSYSSRYDITVKKVDENTVTETGRKTGEVVTRTLIRAEPNSTPWGDVRFSSSNASHNGGIEHTAPTSCPDGVDWYQQFLNDNRKTTAAARGSIAPKLVDQIERKNPTWPGFPRP